MLKLLYTLALSAALAIPLSAAKKKGGAGKTVTQTITPETAAERKKAEAEKASEPTVGPENTSPAAASEMEAYRQIQSRPVATVQDLADVLLMYRGEYAQFATAEKRLIRARELNALKSQNGDQPLSRGTLAYAIMKTYRPEGGWLFWVTGFERYALRDTQEADIMPASATPGQSLSGEQLIGTLTAAEQFGDEKKSHPGTK